MIGIGIMLGVYTSGISGGHINPAVTLTNALLRRFPWRKVPLYFLAQTLGAMTAAAVVYGNYRSAIDAFEGSSSTRTVPFSSSHTPTAGIFATYPAEFMTRTGMFFSEFLGTALLMFSIYALLDQGNIGMPEKLVPVGLFFVLWGIAGCFGWETGFALNPARDFGPRLVTYMIGYGRGVWTAGGGYAWVSCSDPTA
jgi:aquaglyceroporin related protein, other eukaryote